MNLEELKKLACDAIDKNAAALEELSQDIWKNPELGNQEHYAHDRITTFLEDAGFHHVQKRFVLDTGFKASFGSKQRPHILITCEYDALPNIGHACGHNLIAELAVGASLGAKAVISALEDAGYEAGKVSILGTPNEEAGGGKINMIEAGVFNDVDCALMAHPASDGFTFDYRTGFYAASSTLSADFIGQSSHTFTHASHGVNALDAAITAYNSLALFRQQTKKTWCLHPGILRGGSSLGRIPDSAHLEMQMRANTASEFEHLKSKVVQRLEAAATLNECKVKFDLSRPVYKDVVKNSTLLRAYRENAEKSLGVRFDDVIPKGAESAVASTDMGNVSHEVPCIHPVFSLGTTAVNHTKPFTTVTGSSESQPYVLIQAKALAMTAVDVMLKPELIQKMWQDFRVETNKG